MLYITHKKFATNLNKSISRGVFKPKPQLTKNPESINHRVYWWSEHRPYRRTVLDACRILIHTRNFYNLIDPKALTGSELIYKLSLPGPFTGFIPKNTAITPEITNLGDKKLFDFIISHFVSGNYLHRDIIGSQRKPNLSYNEGSEPIDNLYNLSGNNLKFNISKNEMGETIVHVNDARVLRWNIKCHNGLIHIVDRVIV